MTRFRHHGIRVRVHGLDAHSRTLMRRVRREGEWVDYGVEGA